jgi:hypothetical protein
MKRIVSRSICVAAIVLASCNHDQLEQQKGQISTLTKEDSLRLRQVESKDSSLTFFIRTINHIQVNLDSIKQRGNILTLEGESKKDTAAIMADLNAISNLIVQNSLDMAALEKKLHRSNQKNADLEAIITRLNKDITMKDEERATLQKNLAETNTSLQSVIQKLNDTITMALKERNQIGSMTTQMHTVYYTFGKMKDLQKKGIITKEGGFIGIGKTAVLNSSINATSFTQADLTALSSISLNAKLDKVITNHPADSYKVVAGDKSDDIVITDAQGFWSKSKYFVAIIK